MKRESGTIIPTEVIESAILIVKEVGAYIQDIKTSNRFHYGAKELGKYADMRAHKLLSKLLKKNLDILVVSEEDQNSHFINEDYYWLIDPIDGTSSYSNNYNGYVVQCALMSQNQPILSVIYAPYFDKTYYAYKGGGAWLNGKKMHKNLQDNIIYKSIIDNEPSPHDIAEVIYKKLNFNHYIECGSLGLKMCLVAEGVASAFVKSTIVRDWDVAPASLLLKELDYNFTDSYSVEIKYTAGKRSHIGLIATCNKSLHHEITKVISKERENGNFR